MSTKKARKPRYTADHVEPELKQPLHDPQMPFHNNSIGFGDTSRIPQGEDYVVEGEMKSVKNRPPTPVPSLTKLAEVTFFDRVEDLTDPVSNPSYLPERLKTIENVNVAGRILTKKVTEYVLNAMDLNTGKVTMPPMKHSIEWGEAVESIANAVVNNRVQADSADLRQAVTFLTVRVLKSLVEEAKRDRARLKAPDPM